MTKNKRIIDSIGDKRIKNAVSIINSCNIEEVKKVELIYLINVLKNMNNQKKNTGKKDMSGQEVFEGDVIENPDGVCMKICYGTYEAYCPVDKCYMDNVGFYACKFRFN